MLQQRVVAVVGACAIIVAGLCVLHASNEEIIKANEAVDEDFVNFVQLEHDSRDDLTSAEKALIASAGGIATQKQQRVSAPQQVPNSDDLSVDEKALIAAARGHSSKALQKQAALKVAKLKKANKMKKAMEKITKAATKKAIGVSTKAAVDLATKDVAVHTVSLKKNVGSNEARMIVNDHIKRVDKLKQLKHLEHQKNQRLNGHITDDVARQMLEGNHDDVQEGRVEAHFATTEQVNHINKQIHALKPTDSWARMKAKADNKAEADATVQELKKRKEQKVLEVKKQLQKKQARVTQKKQMATHIKQWVRSRIIHDLSNLKTAHQTTDLEALPSVNELKHQAQDSERDTKESTLNAKESILGD